MALSFHNLPSIFLKKYYLIKPSCEVRVRAEVYVGRGHNGAEGGGKGQVGQSEPVGARHVAGWLDKTVCPAENLEILTHCFTHDKHNND